MNSLKIGDSVFYPNQGLGIIEDIQEENFNGEKEKIFYIRISSNNTLVLVPALTAKEIGVRKPISLEKAKRVFDFMKNGEVDVSMNWKGRYKEHSDLMKSGLIKDMAVVLKSLFYLSLIKPLSFREKKMMDKAKELLISEISKVSSMPAGEIEEKMFENLSFCYKDI